MISLLYRENSGKAFFFHKSFFRFFSYQVMCKEKGKINGKVLYPPSIFFFFFFKILDAELYELLFYVPCKMNISTSRGTYFDLKK